MLPRVNKVDAWELVLKGDFLRSQVLLHRHGKIGAAFDRRIVCDDHARCSGNDADPGQYAGSWTNSLIEPRSGELSDFKKGCARIYQLLNTLAHVELAPVAVFLKGGIGRIRTGALALLHERCHMSVKGLVIAFKEGGVRGLRANLHS